MKLSRRDLNQAQAWLLDYCDHNTEPHVNMADVHRQCVQETGFTDLDYHYVRRILMAEGKVPGGKVPTTTLFELTQRIEALEAKLGGAV